MCELWRKCGFTYFYFIVAYKTVLHSYGLDSNPSTDNEMDDGTSDLELLGADGADGGSGVSVGGNHMNDTLTSMYLHNKRPAGGGGGVGLVPPQRLAEGELIDISSDESDFEEKSNNEKISNNSNARKYKLILV